MLFAILSVISCLKKPNINIILFHIKIHTSVIYYLLNICNPCISVNKFFIRFLFFPVNINSEMYRKSQYNPRGNTCCSLCTCTCTVVYMYMYTIALYMPCKVYRKFIDLQSITIENGFTKTILKNIILEKKHSTKKALTYAPIFHYFYVLINKLYIQL